MSEDAPKTARAAQLAMLGLIGAYFILADGTSAEARLDAAKGQVEGVLFASEFRETRERLQRMCKGDEWLFDVPSRLTLGWIYDHIGSKDLDGIKGVRGVYVRGYRVKGQDGDSKERCEPLDRICRVASEGDTSKCNHAGWRALRIVGEQSSQSTVGSALDSDEKATDAGRLADAAAQGLDQARRVEIAEEKEWGWNGSGAKTARGEVSQKEQAVKATSAASAEAEKARRAGVAELMKASTAARDLPEQLGGTHILLLQKEVPVYVVLRVGFEGPGQCILGCSQGVLGTDAETCLDVRDFELLQVDESPAREDSAKDAGIDGSETTSDDGGKCEGGAPILPERRHVLNVPAIVAAGVWKDLRDLDGPSAAATLDDKKTQAELEGEIFGLKVHSKDAIRWLWLPILVLELYAVRMLADRSSAEKEKDDWWAGWITQTTLAVCAATVVVMSLRVGLGFGEEPQAGTSYVPAVAGASALATIWVASSAVVHMRRRKKAPASK